MKKLSLSLIALVLIGVGAAPDLVAQDAGGSGSGAPQVLGGTENFDATGIRRYKLGPGDVVELRVYGQPEFNGPLMVDDDGNVEIPFVDDPVFAKCRTDREVQREITAQLKKYLKKPQVSVRVTERRSRPPAVVYGAIRSPQRVMMNRQIRLLELLAWSGGVTEQAGNEIQIFHTQPVLCPGTEEEDEQLLTQQTSALADGAQPVEAAQKTQEEPAEAAVPRAEPIEMEVARGEGLASGEKAKDQNTPAREVAVAGKVAKTDEELQQEFKKYLGSFELYNLSDLKAGKRAANPIVQPGDVVIVREAAPVYITGGVFQPAAIPLREDMSLRYAIAQAGGLRKDAQSGKIRIFRRVTGKLEPEVIKVNYNDIKSQKRPDIALQPYDVIDVPSSVVTPSNILNMMLGQGVGIASAVGAGLPLRMMY